MVRHKNRYFVIEVSEANKKSSDSLALQSKSSLYFALSNRIQDLHGDFGVAAISAGLTLKYCNERTRIALIRCRHGPHKLIASTLPFVRFVDKKECKITTLYIGATIKNCLKFIQKYQQKKYDEYCSTLKSDEEKAQLKSEIMSLAPIADMS